MRPLCARGAMDRAAYALISAAPADVAGHGGIDVFISGLRFFREECGRRHQLPGLAVATLRHLFRNPGALQRMSRSWRESLNRCDFLRGDVRYRNTARTHRFSIQMDSAGSALLQAAPEFRAIQADCIANNPEQRSVRADIDVILLSIDRYGNHR